MNHARILKLVLGVIKMKINRTLIFITGIVGTVAISAVSGNAGFNIQPEIITGAITAIAGIAVPDRE